MTATPDAYESDDTPEMAYDITGIVGPQARSIHAEDDVDWAKFTVSAESLVTLETSGASGDTRMWLYGPGNATSQIEYDDDSGPGSFSSITRVLSAGEYFVKIDEYSQNDTIENYALTLDVVDLDELKDAYEPDDDSAHATLLTLNAAPQAHSIHHAGDMDWFTFTLSEDSRVILQTDGLAGDTYMELFNSQQSRIEYDYSSGNGNFSRIEAYLPAGTYTASVEERYQDELIDSYMISAQATPFSELVDAYESDDTYQQATPLALDGTPQVHNIHQPDDVDWFTFTLTEDTRVILETDGPSGSTYMELFNSQQIRIEYDYSSGNGNFSRIEAYLPAGTYTAKVQEPYMDEVIESYTISVQATPLSELVDAYESDDTYQQATPLTLNGTPQTHNIHQPADVDWFTFALSEDSRVILETNGAEGSTYMELFDGQQNRLDYDYSSGNGSFSKIIAWLPAGVYTASVESRYQTIDAYSMSATAVPLVQFADSYEQDNSPENATPLIPNVPQSHNLHHWEDVDWYEFTVSEHSSVSININGSQGPGTPALTLYKDGDATDIIADRQYRIYDQILSPGTYYLFVSDTYQDDVIEAYEIELETVILPDLTVSEVAFTAPAGIELGSQLNVAWTVDNFSSGTAESRYDRIYLSEDGQLDGATYIASIYYNEDILPGESRQFSADVTIPDNYNWAGRNAYLIVVANSNGYIDEIDETNNQYSIPITIDPVIELLSPRIGPRVNAGNSFDVQWRVIDMDESAPVRMAIDTDDNPANGVGHTYLAPEELLFSTKPNLRSGGKQATTVQIPNLPARAEPYYLWVRVTGSNGVEYSIPQPIYISDSAASFTEDEYGDSVGSNSTYEVYGLDAHQEDNILHFRVFTNYDPEKNNYTGNSQGGGDFRFVIGGQQYGLAVNDHQAGTQQVTTGDLYVGATFLEGTTRSEVPSFIDTYTSSIAGGFHRVVRSGL